MAVNKCKFLCLCCGMRAGVSATVEGSIELRGGIPLESSPDPASNPGWIQEINPLKPTWLLAHSHKSSVIVPDYTRRCYGHNGWLSAVWQTWLGLQTVNFTEQAVYSEAVCLNSFHSPPPAGLAPSSRLHCTSLQSANIHVDGYHVHLPPVTVSVSND